MVFKKTILLPLLPKLYLMSIKVGENIRIVRDLRGISQQFLADEIGISQKQLSKIENGQVSPTFLLVEKICEKLDISLQELLRLNELLVFNNIANHQQGGEYIAYNNTDVKQIEELYKKLLEEKDKRIKLLESKTRS